MKINTTILVLLLFILNLYATPQGKYTGGSDHSMPSWFKDSFLDLEEDVEEAKENNKHIMLFMSLKFCPYCTKMLNDNFIKGAKNQPFIEKNFDVIAIDIRGSKEITPKDGETLTEKEFAKKLNVQYTPTILFMDQNNNIVVRINGYRSEKTFKNILEYVKNKQYKKIDLSTYLQKVKDKTLYSLKPNKMFQELTDLSNISTPLAVIFEDGGCTQCDYLHNTTLKNKDVINEMKKFTVVRYDADSTKTIITPNGVKTTPKQWAKDLKLNYRPGIVLFNEKKEQARIDALLYSFHFKEIFRYVSGEYYLVYDSFLGYLPVRQGELLRSGVNIDISNQK